MEEELRSKRRDLEKAVKELETIKNKKLLNFEISQPGSPTLKDVMVSGSHTLSDTFLLYAIKDEELDEPYRIALAKYEYAKKEYDNIVKYLAKYDEFILMEFLKNDLGWDWKKIDKYLSHSDDYSRHKYKRHIEEISKQKAR